MRDTIRLLVTEKCNRSCSGCCNKDHDLQALPVFDASYLKKHKKDIKTIIVTGGEPLLFQNQLSNFFLNFLDYKDLKFILYTAFVKEYHKKIGIMSFLDGLTLTFHEQKDVEDSVEFLERILLSGFKKSFRLNVFENIDISMVQSYLKEWDVRTGYKWVQNCPVPDNEIFMRLDKYIGE